jgi:hypothetical protein
MNTVQNVVKINVVFLTEFLTVTPSVVFEWLIFLLRIREVPGSNLGPRPAILRVFVFFLSPSRRMLGKHLKIRPRPFPSRSFPIHHSLITLLFDVI